MTSKEKVFTYLAQNRGKDISGEEMATALGISRAAVWKAVAALREEGNAITAAPNKGYRLSEDSDVVSAGALAALLPDLPEGLLHIEKSVSSTNDEARRLASEGAPNGTVVLAETQTQGRGRRGRSFFSPQGGIYLSMVLRPSMSASESVAITSCAAVAVSRAIREVCGIQAKIKWVNDLYIDDKKICGILTEAVTDLEGGGLEFLVVGIGINFCLPKGQFPQPLQEIATALYKDTPAGAIKTKLTAALIRHLYAVSQNPTDPAIFAEYKRDNLVLGREVEVLSGARTGRAVAADITEQGHLMVRYPDGECAVLRSGEVRLLPAG